MRRWTDGLASSVSKGCERVWPTVRRARGEGKPVIAVLLLLSLISTPAFPTTITDRYGEVLREVSSANDEIVRPVPLASVSPWTVLTVLAAEDRRFYTHRGVDIQATARALWQNAHSGRVISGGSTVTQQLVRLIEPRPKTVAGKLKEAWKAVRLERQLSKQEILEGYLNGVPYGNRLRGIEAASHAYFGVPSHDLSLAQAALLAGIPQSPTRLEPVRHFSAARRRQKLILERMQQWGWLSHGAFQAAIAEKIQIQPLKSAWIAPHFADYVRRHLPAGQDMSQVTTTLNAALQQTLQGLVQTHVDRLRGYHVTNGALVVLDNATGDVLAWVGSADFFDEKHQGQVDGVTALRQPGSALKPFAYAFGFASGMAPSDLLLDEPFFADGFMPRNYDERYHGAVRAREALACSLNVPAVRIAQRLGPESLLGVYHRFGLVSLDKPASHYGLGMVLGNGEVTLLELTNAYATLARGGVWEPVNLLHETHATLRSPLFQGRILDRESVYQVTDILADNAARAPAFGLNSPFHLPFPFAAKTGTTKDFHDNWAVGYTPDWTIGVWVGNFDARPMRGVSGITGAGPLLHDAALVVAEQRGTRPFDRPVGIRELEICPESGELPGPTCPTTMTEMFNVQRLPERTCHVHKIVSEELPAQHQRISAAIEFPAPGDVFKLDPRAAQASQVIRLRSSEKDPAAKHLWFVDGKEVTAERDGVWWTLRPGRHRVRLTLEKDGIRTNVRPVSFLVIP